MKKMVVLCLIIIFAMGNICFAQNAGKDNDRNTYYVDIRGVDRDMVKAPGELSRRHEGRRHYERRHHRDHRHHGHHKHHDHDDDGEDIIKGIIILGIVKEILD